MDISELSHSLGLHNQQLQGSTHIVFTSLAHARFSKSDYVQLGLDLLNLAELTQTTLLIPAYTYSARRGGTFQKNTPPDPQVGALSRVMFEEKLFNSRTIDPDFSYLILGSNKDSAEQHYIRSFGEESFHESILEKCSTKISLVGPVLNTGLTTVLHLEAKIGVPWRRYIHLNHNCRHPKCDSKHEYFAKVTERAMKYSPSRMSLSSPISNLTKTKLSSVRNLSITTFEWSEFSEWFKLKLSENPYFQESQN